MAIRVIQRARSDGSLWLKFSPNGEKRLLDAEGRPILARFPWPWWRAERTSLRTRLQQALLPEDFPASVHRNYLGYAGWNFAHMVVSSTIGVLSTQSLLFGLGLSAGASSLALSSTLNWVLKDGLGQLGGIALVARLGGRFDACARRYRFLAAVALKIACFVEMLVPLWPQWFILTAAMANVMKNASWMATSATRAQIQRHLALRDNLGDLSGKTASQNTLASLLGTGLGVIFSSVFLSNAALSAELAVARCLLIFTPLSLISLFMCYKSCQYARSPRITLSRFHILCKNLFPELFSERSARPCQEVLGQLRRYIPVPEAIVRREPLLFRAAAPSIPVLVEPDARALVIDEKERDRMFWVQVEGEGPLICIWFAEAARDEDILRGLLTVELVRHFLAHRIDFTMAHVQDLAADLFSGLRDALSIRGWQQSEIDVGRRRPVRVLVDKDE